MDGCTKARLAEALTSNLHPFLLLLRVVALELTVAAHAINAHIHVSLFVPVHIHVSVPLCDVNAQGVE